MKQWYQHFLESPDQALSDLFSGRAGIGSSFRLDTPELLYQTFAHLPKDSEPRILLDNTLLAWLKDMHKTYAKQVARLGFAVYSKRLCDALTTIQFLVLPNCIEKLRAERNFWLNWFEPLRLAPERDPALEFWRVLSYQQTAQTNPMQWLQLACDVRREYLSVALVGLQRMPNQHDAKVQQLQLRAILQHAITQADIKKAEEFFHKQYAALRGLYPASPEHWQHNLVTTLDNFEKHSALNSITKELIKALQTNTKKPTKKQPAAHLMLPVDKKDFDALFNDIKNSKQSGDILAERLFKLLNTNYAYAMATGDSYYFILMLSKHGTQLLKRHKLTNEMLNHLQIHIERALSLQPMNEHIWTLWSQCLAKLQRLHAQEWVLREATRLFPNNEPSRVELARLLMRSNRDDEAEKLLREVMAFSQNNEQSRTELARLLMRLNRDVEAEKLLREVMAFSPNNEPSRTELARLLMRLNRDVEAEDILREVMAFSPNHEPSRTELARLFMRLNRDDEAEKLLREVMEFSQNNEQSRTELARLLMRLNRDAEAEDILREAVKRNPNGEASRTELARLLIKRYYYTDNKLENDLIEAEQLLKNIIQHNSNDGQTHEILAKLYLKQANVSQAKTLLTEYLKRCHDNKAQQLLTEIQNNSFDVSDWLIHGIQINQQLAQNTTGSRNTPQTHENNLTSLLTELKHRHELQTAFNAKNHEQLIDKAQQGNILANFYYQWLQPQSITELPPNSWAMLVSDYYHKKDTANWENVKMRFPQHKLATRFVQALIDDNKKDCELLLNKLNYETKTPLNEYMQSVLKGENSAKQDDQVLAVLASQASGVLQFS